MFVALLAVACTRETPAPPTEDVTPVTTTTATQTGVSAVQGARYDDAVTWFRTTPGFHFELTDGDVFATGQMVRPNIGAERLTVSVKGESWTAESGPKGVGWRRDGKETPAPEWGNRVWQRITVAFDPQKSEGEAQLVEPGHFRFTDANTGAVHDVWIDAAGQIAKMKIGDSVQLTLNPVK